MFDKIPNGTQLVFANTIPFKKAIRRDKTLSQIQTTRSSGYVRDKEKDPALHGKILVQLRRFTDIRYISGDYRGSWAVSAYFPNPNKPTSSYLQKAPAPQDPEVYLYCGTKTIRTKADWDAHEDIMYIIRHVYPKLCEYGECHY